MNRREYSLALLVGAVGAGLIWLALREQWAQAVFTQPKPLPQETVGVSGAALSPLAGALAIAALACLAAVIATRGVWRRGVGVVLALFGAGAGAAVTAAVSASSVVNTAMSQVGSPGAAAISGTAGSTTSGTSSGTPMVVAGSAGHAVMNGTEWRFAVMAGALLIVAAGLLTLMHGQDWPVMSSRYELPQRRATSAAGESGEGAGDVEAGAEGDADDHAEDDTAASRARDSASMWESLSGGEDPTEAMRR
ncbi:MAG TPA: Trp biosynthesis-associated membrane protein [Trebonia sp.]|nr:Trp biosynthesis-associated membrane protein [Trebonia sp.]